MSFSLAVEGVFLQLIRRIVVGLFYLLQTEQVSFNTNTYHIKQVCNPEIDFSYLMVFIVYLWPGGFSANYQNPAFTSRSIDLRLQHWISWWICMTSQCVLRHIYLLREREREREGVCVCVCVCVCVWIPFSAWNTYFVMTDEHGTDPQQYFNRMNVGVMFLVKTQRFE